MKWLIAASFILASTLSFAQKPLKCPNGSKPYGGYASTSLVVEYGCYTPVQIKKAERDFAINMCGEMGEFMGGGDWEYIRRGSWDYKADRCDNSEHWYHVRWDKDERTSLEVTKDEYMQATCQREVICDDKGCRVLYPKPEWAHCKTK
jgi:hypothetical protein